MKIEPSKPASEQANAFSIEPLADNQLDAYHDFFARIVTDLPFYTDDEKRHAVELRTPQVLIERRANGRHLYRVITTPGGAIIAALEATLLTNRSKAVTVGYINWVLVAPSYRRGEGAVSGLARRLYVDAEHEFRRRGCARIIAEVNTANSPSLALHERMGFRRSTTPAKRADTLLFVKPLR